MARRIARPLLLALCLAWAGLAGCGAEEAPEAPPPAVGVARAEKDVVPATFEFVGQTESVNEVEVPARIEGELLERSFVEGSDVGQGQLLFVIDPSEYEAEAARLRAQLAGSQAEATKTKADLDRAKVLFDQDVLSRANYDRTVAAQAEAEAKVRADEAALQKAELNLSYTRITAPIAGRIGRTSVDIGNVVRPLSGPLAVITQLDPMYVTFNVSERVVVEVRRAQLERGETGRPPRRVQLLLSDGSLYEYEGALDFADTKVDETTGTVTIRASFDNPDDLLRPGQYVKVLLTDTADMEPKLLVPQAAVQENQAGRFVLVVGADEKVEQRPVVAGQRVGNRWVIDEGLAEGDRVIVEGLQKVRPGMRVQAAPAQRAEPLAP